MQMKSNTFIQMVSQKSCSDNNYFHEACQARSLALLVRVEKWMDQPMPSLLTQRNYNGEQCTHIIARNDNHDAWEMMWYVVKYGADINGQESLGGFTPLQICVWLRNYMLAEWLCMRPDVNLEATNFAGQTAYDLAVERKDPLLEEMLKLARDRQVSLKVRRSVRIANLKKSK